MSDNYGKDPEAISRLTPEQYRVTQQKGTEPAFHNEYWDNKEPGLYVDVVSGEPLFASVNKYDSHTGWPSFTVPVEPSHVIKRRDFRHLMIRTEVALPSATATWAMCSATGQPKPGGCATASTPPPSASSRSMTWNARVTAPTATYRTPHPWERIPARPRPWVAMTARHRLRHWSGEVRERRNPYPAAAGVVTGMHSRSGLHCRS